MGAQHLSPGGAEGLESLNFILNPIFNAALNTMAQNPAAYATCHEIMPCIHHTLHSLRVCMSLGRCRHVGSISPTPHGLPQVGWEWRGLAVWSPSGCRLVCSLRQSAQDSSSTPRVMPGMPSPFGPPLKHSPSYTPLPLEVRPGHQPLHYDPNA